MKRLIACQECKRQWDVSRYEPGQKLRCVCTHVMEVPPAKAHTPEIHHCEACGAARENASTTCSYCGAVPIADSARMTLVCPFCYHRTAWGSRFCSTCGEAIQASTIDTKTGKLQCPRCRKLKLINRKVGAFVVDECPGCAGMWVEFQMFDRLVKQQAAREEQHIQGTRPGRPKKAPITEGVVYIKCPECERLMNRFNFARVSGVIIDECQPHGVWLDADELSKIADYVVSGGLRHTETLKELDAKAAESQAAIAISSMHTIPSYTTDRDHGTSLGSLLELIGKLL